VENVWNIFIEEIVNISTQLSSYLNEFYEQLVVMLTRILHCGRLKMGGKRYLKIFTFHNTQGDLLYDRLSPMDLKTHLQAT